MEFRLEPFHRDLSDDELIADIRRVNSSLAATGESLTFRTYSKHGTFAASTIAERFGTWNGALEKAGIAPVQEKSISIDDLFDNLRAVWIAKGRQPVFRDMKQEPSRYTATTYTDRFGGWRKALVEFLKSVASESVESPAATNSVVVRESPNRRRTKRDPSLRLKFRVMRRDDFKCVKCGRAPALEPGLILEVDHVLAWSQGGETVQENLQTLCYDCNRGKADSQDRIA